MPIRFNLAEETLGYVTSQDESNTDFRLLVAGSKNVLIDYQKKVKIRGGTTRLGAANTSLNNIRNAWTWHTSTGENRGMRFYDDELEMYLESVDGISINAWVRVANNWSTTELLRSIIQKGGNGGWYDSTEKIDLCLMVIGNANIYEYNGAVATIASTSSNTITKNGTTTWAQNRFYTSRNKTLIINGTEYTYTGGEGTTTLTGVTPDPSGEAVNSLVIQKIVTQSNKPGSSRTNHYIYNFNNQIVIGSEDDNLIYGSSNTDYTDFSFSSPRTVGEGFLFTLDNPTRAITSLGPSLLIGSGKSVIFNIKLVEIAVGTSLTESANIERLDVGVNQGFLNQESIVPVGDTIFFLTNEVALRTIENPQNLVGINPRTMSNPIKPDFDFETWYDNNNKASAFGTWYKNILFFTAPQTSRTYMLNFVEDADGKTFRFWNAPQVLPVGPLTLMEIDNVEMLYGHSNAVPETYLLFDGTSDGQYADMPTEDKLPIDAHAIFAYNSYKKKGVLKNFDEYYVEGEITPSTTGLEMILRYDFDGSTQEITKIIDGADEDILEGVVGNNSLAQQSLAVNPLGGLLNPPSDSRRFRVIFELAKEDFFEIQTEFTTNDVDKYWSILTHGANAEISKRKPINKKI